jgi:peptide/nickel transport system ATP-binding protein
MIPVEGDEFHASRCIRVDEIDWNAPVAARRPRPTRPGDVVLKVDDLTKHYAIEDKAISSRAKRAR